MVPISTAIGSSSYRLPGSSSMAPPTANHSVKPGRPIFCNSSTKSMKKDSDRKASATKATDDTMSRYSMRRTVFTGLPCALRAAG